MLVFKISIEILKPKVPYKKKFRNVSSTVPIATIGIVDLLKILKRKHVHNLPKGNIYANY